jgi:membrane-associated PAP2 superfamily phosphatase
MPSFLAYYRRDDGRRFLLRQMLGLLGSAIALLALFGLTDLDRTVTRTFFDAARGVFPLTNDWWLKIVLHDAARTVSAVGALALLGVTGTAWLVPRLARAHALRQELAFVAAAALAAAATVTVLKHFSGHGCPWALSDFGGSGPYRHLFTGRDGLPSLDGCFPAAHPLVGYAWLCVGLVLYPASRRVAKIWTRTAFVVGTALGFVQVLRGAHFVSHVLWSAWTAWTIAIALLMLCRWYGPNTAPAPDAARIGATS